MKARTLNYGSGIAVQNFVEVRMNRAAVAMALISILITFSESAHAGAQTQALSSAKMTSVARLMDLKQLPPKSVLLDQMKTRIDSLSARAHGGVDTGGGTLVISKDGRKDLLDLVNFAPRLLENSAPGIALPKDNAFRAAGIQLLKSSDLGLYQDLKAKVAVWRSTSPYAAEVLEKALDNVPLYFFNYKLGSALADQNAFGLSGRATEPVARYLRKFGVLVSRPDFEGLSYINQQAVVVHETLRHIAIAYDYRMSDENLQRMTAAVLRGPAHATDSLDTVQNISDGWVAEILRGEYERLSVQENADLVCKILDLKKSGEACANLSDKNRNSEVGDLTALKDSVKAYSDIRQEISDWMIRHPGSAFYSDMSNADEFFSRMIALKNGYLIKIIARSATDDALALDRVFKVGGAIASLNDPAIARKSYYHIQNELNEITRQLVDQNILINR